MISKYLKALVDSNNRIIIPDFGAFMIQDSPSGKQISFNDFLKFNDGLLVNQIIKTEKVSKNQASEQIKEFITAVEKSFAQNKPYEISGLGFLSKDSHGNIKFETKIESVKETKKPVVDEKPIVILDEPVQPAKEIKKEEKVQPVAAKAEKLTEPQTASAPKVEEKKIEIIEPVTPKIEEKKPELASKQAVSSAASVSKPIPKAPDKKPISKYSDKKSNAPKIIIGIIVVALILGGGTYAYLNFATHKKQIEPTVAAIPEPIVDTLNISDSTATDTIATEPTVIEEPKPASTGKQFYLVAGSFKVTANAERFNKKVSSEGFQSEIIERSNGFKCVTLGAFGSKEEAVAEWHKLKDDKAGIWILAQ